MAAAPTTAGLGGSRLLRTTRRLDPAPLVTLVAVVVVWQIASLFASSQVVPSVGSVISRLGDIVTSASSLKDYAITLARIMAGLVTAFAIGSVIGLATGAKPGLGRYLLPAVRFFQGIPSLSWVVLAVIWFKSVELRIWFIMMMVTLPGFTLQLHDSYRAIARELRDMARSFRPTRLLLFREVTLPAVAPGMFTAWKVNLGLGIRVVLIAELVGATTGIGVRLLDSQQLFDMTGVVAWTLLLALSALAIQAVIEVIEDRALAYRPKAEERARVPVAAT
jgi:NitT/TauT family transport system permease protein